VQNRFAHLCVAGLIVGCGAALNSFAAETPTLAEEPAPPIYWPWTVGLEGGSTGFGGSGSWRFSDHLGLRLGADYLQYSKRGVEIDNIHYDTKLRLLSEPLTLNIYPWQKHSFYLSLGMMLNQNQLTGSASGDGTIIIDGKEFTRDQVGDLNMKIHQQPVNPYLSIGGNFLYFDHAHHWALGGELGVAYTGDPTASLTRSGGASGAAGILVDQAVQGAQDGLQHYAEQFKWWPVIKLSVSYAF